MQPEFAPSPRPIEQAPPSPGVSYEIPAAGQTPEILPAASPEQRIETRPSAELAPPPPPVPPMPTQPVPPVPQQSTSVTLADDAAVNPMAANDDDVIEKEWVDRAKQVILQTKDNPFAREKAIGELQRDYLMKRYGRQIGSSDD